MNELLEQTINAKKRLQEAVNWNFGYVGNDPEANKRLEDLAYLEGRLKKEQPEEYKKYIEAHYKD